MNRIFNWCMFTLFIVLLLRAEIYHKDGHIIKTNWLEMPWEVK